MSIASRIVSVAGFTAFTALFCAAQSISPSRSGTVHYFEGDVTIDGVKLVSQVARFSDVKDQGVLKTGLGRAEILLTPGILLRIGENTSIKMLDSRLMSTRVELLSGTAMVEALEADTGVKDPAVTIVYKDFSAQPVKYGIFEMTTEPGQLRVFKGEAKVFGNGTSVNVKDGNRIDLGMTMATSKFDAKVADDLYLWSRDRSAYLSAGNLSSARALASSGRAGYAGAGWNAPMWRSFSGGWYYNSYLNMYSFMPFAGSVFSPFGYRIYNPVTIGYIYDPGYYWSGAGGARNSTTTGVALSAVPSSVLAGRQSEAGASLPRLGTTATLRPVPTAPLRGTSISAPVNAYEGRNNGFGQPAGFGGMPNFGSALSRSVSAPMSSPAMSAPAPVMSAPAPVAAPAPVSGGSAGRR